MLGKSQGSFTTLFSSRIQNWWELTSVITGSHWYANPVLATWGVGCERELWGDSHSVLTSEAVVDLLPTTEAKGNTAQNYQTQAAFQLGHLPITRAVKADIAHCGVRGAASKHLGAPPLSYTRYPGSFFTRVPDEKVQISPGARPDTSPWKLTQHLCVLTHILLCSLRHPRGHYTSYP